MIALRYLSLVVFAGVTLSGQAVPPPAGLDRPMGATVLVEDLTGRNPCRLWTALEQLARQAQVRIGVEQTLNCSPAPWVLRPYCVTQMPERPIDQAAQEYAGSRHAFDTWFKAQVKLITGVDPELAPLGPPTACIFDSTGQMT